MRNLQHTLLAAGAAVAFMLGTQAATAQERQRGNFDPEQMRQRMMERYRESLEVKNDDEWKLIETRITKVTDAQRDARSGMMSAFGRGGFGGRRGGGGEGNNTG